MAKAKGIPVYRFRVEDADARERREAGKRRTVDRRKARQRKAWETGR